MKIGVPKETADHGRDRTNERIVESPFGTADRERDQEDHHADDNAERRDGRDHRDEELASLSHEIPEGNPKLERHVTLLLPRGGRLAASSGETG